LQAGRGVGGSGRDHGAHLQFLSIESVKRRIYQ
jgi:hypothetical protein